MPLPFYRFKKKSLILAYILCPEDFCELIQEIRYKKLFQCLLREDLRKTPGKLSLKGHTN